ncbi:hypothetical protein G6L91_11500 [Agrobacterium rhizogenes]|uniref:hypothetical protein n=1 Tax=Rhizobium rhizogenes TaxID=359 RepID=UPI0015718093|nr:hypothetical protein [Rhizobium rhizogenes]NTF62092.1 hypothetical protein [Rhizobium rhizogenes]
MFDDIVLNPKRYGDKIAGIRWNGVRWVDAEPAAGYELAQPPVQRAVYPPPDPGGFTFHRKPPRQPVKRKTRRKGPPAW